VVAFNVNDRCTSSTALLELGVFVGSETIDGSSPDCLFILSNEVFRDDDKSVVEFSTVDFIDGTSFNFCVLSKVNIFIFQVYN
jgi:hypothetical protein